MSLLEWHWRTAVSHHQPLPALDRSVALTVEGLIRPHAFHQKGGNDNVCTEGQALGLTEEGSRAMQAQWQAMVGWL